MPFSEAQRKLLDALAVIATHGHPHYKSERQKAMLESAREYVERHAQWLEREDIQIGSVSTSTPI